MGGSIIRLASQGHRVHLLDMTDGEPTPNGSPEIRARESAAAARIMGVARSLVGLRNREVVHSVESRHRLAGFIRIHRPDWLFLPYPIDAHPDHVAVTQIGEDARFDAKLTKTDIPGEPWHPRRIIYYFCTHLRLSIQPSFCLDISQQVEAKMAAIECYQSQFGPGNPVPKMVQAMNAYFGGRIGTAHAEPFFSHEVVGLSGLDQLI